MKVDNLIKRTQKVKSLRRKKLKGKYILSDEDRLELREEIKKIKRAFQRSMQRARITYVRNK